MPEALHILKFGGSSVGTAAAIRRVAAIVAASPARTALVVSAQQGVTDQLLDLAGRPAGLAPLRDRIETLRRDLGMMTPAAIGTLFAALEADLRRPVAPAPQRDRIAAYGERISAVLMADYLQSQHIAAVAVDAAALIRTDSRFGDARWDAAATRPLVARALRPLLAGGTVPVVTGFIGSDAQGAVTTLGRGGSDLTASILADCLDAALIQIWSDADGILSADPRRLPTARRLARMTYAEAVELSNFGGKILYNRTLVPAVRRGIPIEIRNTFNPESPGTRIAAEGASDNFVVTQKQDVTAVTVSNPEMIAAVGYLAELFRIFGERRLSVDVVTVSEASVSVTLSRLDAATRRELERDLARLGGVTVRPGAAIVAVVSPRLADQRLFAALIGCLEAHGIRPEMISYGNSAINLMLVVPQQAADDAVRLLHDHLAGVDRNREAA